MERFGCKTEIIAGAGALETLRELRSRRLLVVTEPGLIKNGWARRILALSGAVGEISDGAETAAADRLRPDTLAALGGDAVQDRARLLADETVHLVAIPTDISGWASPAGVLPDAVLLDRELLGQVPPEQVGAMGFRVLADALESYTALGAGDISGTLAMEAFCLTFAHLPAACGGSGAALQKLCTAAGMAGMALSRTGLGLCRALYQSLGSRLPLSKGQLSAMLLPAVINCNAHGAGDRYARLARGAGLGGSSDALGTRTLKNGLVWLRQELKLPKTLWEAGIRPQPVRQQAGDVVAQVLRDPACRTNPVPVEDFMVRRILEEITGRI